MKKLIQKYQVLKEKLNKAIKAEIYLTERQLDEQLIQCKARIAMLEDLNRDYKNTINLLRSQLEIKNVGMANHNQGHHCCGQT
jgi:chromosome condensin MukBEF complex kleisin-like MukF subunit